MWESAPAAPRPRSGEIEELMTERARAGRSVVRLKGGDPFVFGRGGEEAEALAAAGSPVRGGAGRHRRGAAPAYAGIPLTHREDASAVAFVTGHEDPAKDGSGLDWDALARFPGPSSSTWASSGCPRWPSAWSRRGASPASPRPPSSEGRCRASEP